MFRRNEKTCQKSTDRILWEKSEMEYVNRLKAAEEGKDNPDIWIKSNALLILYTYYRLGWIVAADTKFADECLMQSAELGHSRSCYELARRLWEDGKKDDALRYIERGLANIGDRRFDSQLTGHNQASMQDLLIGCRNFINMKTSTRPSL